MSKQKIVIAQMICDEHRYLDEWLRYHLSPEIGIDHIILYEDVTSKSHKEICDKYENVTLLDLCESLSYEYQKIISYNNDFYIQDALLGSIIPKLKEDYDWLFFIDPDEYIDSNPQWMLSNHLDDSVVCISNIMMTDDDLLQDPPYEYSVVEKYKTKVNYELSQNKYFINLHHELFKDGLSFQPLQTPHRMTKNDAFDCTNQCHHYLFKTWPEYISRLAERGQMCDQSWNRTIEEFFVANKRFARYKDRMMNRLKTTMPDFKVKVDAQHERVKRINELLQKKQEKV